MEPKWLQNGSLEASGRPLGAHRLRHRFVIDFGLHCGSHFGSQKRPKWNWNFVEIRAQVLKVIFGHLEASWGRFGVDLGLMLGSFFGPQPEKQIFWESCPRLHGGILFKGPRGSKT